MNEIPLPSPGFFEDAWMRLRSNRAALFPLISLAFLLTMALIGPLISPYSYSEIHLELKNTPPCQQFWFGTDELGRDLFTRIWWGARISLFIGITAATIDVMIGVLWGSIAAFLGGKRRIDDADLRCPLCNPLFARRDPLDGDPRFRNHYYFNRNDFHRMDQHGKDRTGSSTLHQTKRLYRSGPCNWRLAASDSFFPLDSELSRSHYCRNDIDHSHCNFYRGFFKFFRPWHPSSRSKLGSHGQRWPKRYALLSLASFFPAAMITLTMLSFNLLGNALRDALDPRLRR